MCSVCCPRRRETTQKSHQKIKLINLRISVEFHFLSWGWATSGWCTCILPGSVASAAGTAQTCPPRGAHTQERKDGITHSPEVRQKTPTNLFGPWFGSTMEFFLKCSQILPLIVRKTPAVLIRKYRRVGNSRLEDCSPRVAPHSSLRS